MMRLSQFSSILIFIIRSVLRWFKAAFRDTDTDTEIARVGRVGEDPREDVGVGVDVGVLE